VIRGAFNFFARSFSGAGVKGGTIPFHLQMEVRA
jgi:hypothetical protein